MMREPTLAAIYAAERRVAQSEQDTRDGLRRVRVAFRAALTRPSTLALIAGAGGLFGFWLARRPQTTSSSAGVGTATTASGAGLVLAFIGRYAMQRLPSILGWVARQYRAARAGPHTSQWPETGRSETRLLH
jgi:hypothetical protein